MNDLLVVLPEVVQYLSFGFLQLSQMHRSHSGVFQKALRASSPIDFRHRSGVLMHFVERLKGPEAYLSLGQWTGNMGLRSDLIQSCSWDSGLHGFATCLSSLNTSRKLDSCMPPSRRTGISERCLTGD